MACTGYIVLFNFIPQMNRRDTIKTIMAASGAFVALPAWAEAWSSAEVQSHASTFSIATQETLAAVADTIIPPGNEIGALSVGVDRFLLKLFANCYEKEVQENVTSQLLELDNSSQAQHQRPFKDCSQQEREALLLQLSASEDQAEQEFFKLVKSETIRGFNTSREVMINYLHFRQVPGHYYGCVDVNA